MNTKETIQNAALKLFNERGFLKVTTRHIAAEINISHGNLCYHYKNKEAILDAIFRNMRVKFEEPIPSSVPLTLRHLDNVLRAYMNFQLTYRFFFQDTVDIIRQIPEIQKSYTRIQQHRKKEYDKLIQKYIDEEYFIYRGSRSTYKNITEIILFITNFWIADNKIQGKENHQQKINHTLELIWNMLHPYLTLKGQSEYKEAIQQNFNAV